VSFHRASVSILLVAALSSGVAFFQRERANADPAALSFFPMYL
jgi:hypothetical protein